MATGTSLGGTSGAAVAGEIEEGCEEREVPVPVQPPRPRLGTGICAIGDRHMRTHRNYIAFRIL